MTLKSLRQLEENLIKELVSLWESSLRCCRGCQLSGRTRGSISFYLPVRKTSQYSMKSFMISECKISSTIADNE